MQISFARSLVASLRLLLPNACLSKDAKRMVLVEKRVDIGYQVRGDNKTNRSSTKLTFCTVGILLRRLQGDRYLKGVTHVLLDEVHERSLDSDFALALLRDVPDRRRRMNLPLLKLVLMSATIDSDLFSRYLDNARVVTAPGRTFPVSTVFLENIHELLEYVLDPENSVAARVALRTRRNQPCVSGRRKRIAHENAATYR